MDRRSPGIGPEIDSNQESVPDEGTAAIDPATVARIRKALANPRPPVPAAEAFARVDARIAEYKAKQGLKPAMRLTNFASAAPLPCAAYRQGLLSPQSTETRK
jgi:hypothetical protein